MKKELLTLTLVLAAATICASGSPSVVKDKAFYEGITYQWNDGSNNSHTSNLTEVATDPHQVMALIKEVFTNRNIPGIYYGGYTQQGDREGPVSYDISNYEGNTGLENQWKIPQGEHQPNEEGYTTLMVFVKNSWGKGTGDLFFYDALTYIGEAIDSVKLLYDATRFNADSITPNPGTLYKLSGAANRFYFISKGRARRRGGDDNNPIAGYSPFYGMFEEYSPVGINDSTGLENFYAKMTGGETFKVSHDCTSVPSNDHYFCMSGVNGTEQFVLNDLAFFIPDKRLTSWSKRDIDGTTPSRYANYYEPNAPACGLYTIHLTASGAQNEDEGKWDITLNWTSKLDEITGNTVNQDFSIFVKDEATGELTPLLDAEGNPVVVHGGYTYTYTVDKEEHGRNITYVVTGKPAGAPFSEVSSNEAKVGVPGMDANERLILGIGTETESEYILAQEVNQYRNYVKMSNAQGTSITGGNLDPDKHPQFTFYRYPNSENEVPVPFATMEIKSKEGLNYHYEVTYAHQDGAVESKYPAKTGTFTCANESNADVDFGNFKVCDQFNASTAENAHSRKYYYRVTFKNDDLGESEDYHSPFNDIKVYKTTATTDEQVFTMEQAVRDSVRSARLPLSDEMPHLAITALEKDFAIQQYEARQVTNPEKTESAMFGHAQRLADAGRYGIFEQDQHVSDVAHTDGARIHHNGFGFGSAYFFPVISTYRGNPADNNINTYGAPLLPTARVGIEATANEEKVSTYTFNKDGVQGRYYVTQFSILPKGVDLEEVVKFRIWRQTPDGTAMEVAREYLPRLRQDSHPVDIVVTDGTPAIAEGQEPEFSIHGIVSMQPTSDGVQVTAFDVFGAKLLEESETMSVTYLIRMYCKRSLDGNEMGYYIAETTAEVTFTHETPTSIDDVNALNMLTKTQYINPLGQVSSTPFGGVNIVVSTYSNGMVIKTKKVF